MIPLPVILAELIMALGAALFGANAYALIRSRRTEERATRDGERAGDDLQDRPPGPQVPPPPQLARGKILVQMLIGLVVFAWGLATFLVRINA